MTTVDTSPARSALARALRAVEPVLDVSPLLSFDRLGFQRHALRFRDGDLDVDMAGRRCLVTGANSGIGYECASALAERGAEVVMICRSAERGRDARDRIRRDTGNDAVTLTLLDLSDLGAVEAAARDLAARPADVVIHNAGLLPDERIVTDEGWELTFATHVLGPHRLTAGLRPALAAADHARVIWVSSGGMLTRRLEIDDPNWERRPYDGVKAYAETKRAQVVLAELWAEELRSEGVSVNAMHPGWADTSGVRKSLPRFRRLTRAILRTPAEGADTAIWLAVSEPAKRHTGRFFFDREPVRTHWLPTTRASEGDRRRLWAICEGTDDRPWDGHGPSVGAS